MDPLKTPTVSWRELDDKTPGPEILSSGPPKKIGRYRVVKVLGEGGFGVVYLGQDDQLERPVAIKVPHPHRIARPQDVEAYLAEARMLAGLDHTHIVPVHDVGFTEEGMPFVVSKFIEGSNLRDEIKKVNLSPNEAAELVASIAEALHHAHQKGLVHRDVKPSNILLDDQGKAYLADFGLAMKEENFGKGAAFAGTPAYMSPEQARGEGHRVDGRSDIFSLGVVFYELLTGQRPFQGNSQTYLAEQIIAGQARPPRQIKENLPRELERICLKALAKKATERYASAQDMAGDLRQFLAGVVPQPVSSPARIVPKGLRCFDAGDADFFLELLPGPRDREGLPENIRFWKTRIEEPQPDKTFTVGLIYGPSGCGKSSLVEAGLLPRLARNVVPVYVEASATETEGRLLNSLRRQCPDLPDGLGLTDCLADLRHGGLPGGKKVLIILDQFEQWLHSGKGPANTELVQALRQCDGEHVQCLVLVRDDFWLAVSRFFDELEIQLLQGQNSALLDLFDPRHAQKVLTAFGQAHGALPENGELTGEQKGFVEQAVSGLAQEGKVISVRLALFAEMVKGKPWTPATLKEIGGTEGVGVTFLEETFSAKTAPAEHRHHQQAARAVLKALLPGAGTDIKGHRQSYSGLWQASGYGHRAKDFEDLLRILDSDLRLLTPTDPEGIASSSADKQAGEKFYQLTHDYLVPSLRDWLTRRQKETRRGRAELLLADRASVWNARPENRQLPSLLQWCRIRLLTRKRNWKPPEKKMMRKAGSYHVLRAAAVAGCMILAGWLGWDGYGRLKAQTLRDRLLESTTAEVPGIIKDMAPYRRWLGPLLQEAYAQAETNQDAGKKLHAGLALLPADPGQVEFLYGRLLKAEPQEIIAIREVLRDHQHELTERMWTMLDNPKKEPDERFRAACALASYDPDNPRWKKAGPDVAAMLVTQKPFLLSRWTDALRGVAKCLIPTLADFLVDEKRSPGEKGLIATIYGSYAANNPDVYARLEKPLAEPAGLGASLKARVALAKTRAGLGAALMVMGRPEKVWPLFQHRPDPTLRSFLIDRLGPEGVDPRVLFSRLDQEKEVSARRAILLSLGGFGLDRLSPVERQKHIPRLLQLYRDDPDPGVHGAAEWLLRKWQVSDRLKEIDTDLAGRKGKGKRLWYLNRQGQTMIMVIRPGEYWMGEGQEKFRQKIDHGFAIASKEVTVEQFLRFRKDHRFDKNSSPTGNCPVNMATWYEAAEYCNWLNEQEKVPQDQWCYLPNPAGHYAEGMKMAPNFLQRTGYRLPTEAEWEYACRAGARSKFFFGQANDVLAKYARFSGNAPTRSLPVGSLKPNDLGLFDMHGNVVEWMLDNLGVKASDQPEPLHEIKNNLNRVLRGGGFLSQPDEMRCANREATGPTLQLFLVGFRVARTLPPP